VQAAAAHLANLDAPGAPAAARKGGNGLAPWQKRRVTDMMHDRLEHDVTLQELARACGLRQLSPPICGEFALDFEEATLLPPAEDPGFRRFTEYDASTASRLADRYGPRQYRNLAQFNTR
jgi:hypothetical protein